MCIRQSEHSVDLGQIKQLFVDSEEGVLFLNLAFLKGRFF